MHTFGITRSAIAAALVIVAAAGAWRPAQAQQHAAPPVPLPPVEVSALRDPVEKSYRRIVEGMDVFEGRRELAPAAPLRFKLLPRRRDTRMEGVALAIVGDAVHVPVDVASDHTFAVGRHPRALRENAVVTPNRAAGSMTWRADIRTPGLPPHTRRLGDLRLECLVGMAAGLVSPVPASIVGEIVGTLADRAYCDQRRPHYLFFAERALWSVTLVHGTRREVLPVDDMYAGISRSPMSASQRGHCDCEVLLDRTYYAPLGDPSWPDDTLLHFEYMEDDGMRTRREVSGDAAP